MTHEEFIAETYGVVIDALRDHEGNISIRNKFLSMDDLLYAFHVMDLHLQGEGDLFMDCVIAQGVWYNTIKDVTRAQKILLVVFAYLVVTYAGSAK